MSQVGSASAIMFGKWSKIIPKSCITWATRTYSFDTYYYRAEEESRSWEANAIFHQKNFSPGISSSCRACYSFAVWLWAKSAALKIFWISANTELADCEASTLQIKCTNRSILTWQYFDRLHTCGEGPSSYSTRPRGRWGCDTAPTSSQEPPRYHRSVWKD